MKFKLNFRLAFFIFALCYLSILIGFLILNIANMPIQWDEAAHLDNGMFLKLGIFNSFSRNLFYPPLYDVLTFLSYSLFGVNIVSARIIDALFSVLLLWVVFEFTYKAYDGKTALLAVVFLSVMPGYFEASHFAMLDITMTFFFTLSIFFFYFWLQTSNNKMLILTAITLIIGFLAKYQVVVAILVMFIGVLIFCRSRLKQLFLKKPYVAIILVLSALVAYLVYSLHSYIEMWLGIIVMSTRGSQTVIPTFYLTETQSIYSTIHPISLFMYLSGFFGLGVFIIRRQKPDKLFLIWFITVFVFYTIVTNKNWRYVIPFYPVLAISAAVFVIVTYTKLRSRKKILAKISALILIAFTCVSLLQSVNDNITWINFGKTPFALEQAVDYAITHNNSHQSIMVLCPDNLFSQGIIQFYLLKDGRTQIHLYSYPLSPTDDLTFNITTIISRCKQYNVKFLFTTEYGGNSVSYFNSTLTLMDIYTQIYNSGNFTQITPQQTFGQLPRRIFILNFTG